MRLSAEILIKASWHLKSSVIRQPIWVKRAPFWLSYIRPTLETGKTQANKAAGQSRHFFTRCDVIRESATAAGWNDQVSLGSGVYVTQAICLHVICSGRADACRAET